MLPVEAQAARRSADHVGVRERGRHAVVFEAARGVHALVLQEQLAGLHADEAGHAVRRVEQRLPFADRDDLVRRGERQQVAEPPDAAERERFVPAAPLGLELFERFRNRRASPSRRRRRGASRKLRSWCALRRRRTLPRNRASRSVDRRGRFSWRAWMPPQFPLGRQSAEACDATVGGAHLARRDSRMVVRGNLFCDIQGSNWRTTYYSSLTRRGMLRNQRAGLANSKPAARHV